MDVANKQVGFTLIELVVVIVILGILAATALPKFIDMTSDAQQAAVSGVVGALNSAATTNYSGRVANTAAGVPVTNCRDVTNAMSGMPTGYTINNLDIAAGASATCSVTGPGGYTGSFTAIGLS